MPFKDWNRPGDQPQSQTPNAQAPSGNLKQQPQQKKMPQDDLLKKKKENLPKPDLGG